MICIENERPFYSKGIEFIFSLKYMKEVIEVSVNTVNNMELYTTKAFENGTELRSQLEKCLQDKAKSDRQKVEHALESGKSQDEVFAAYDNNENFEKWYKEVYEGLKDIVG